MTKFNFKKKYGQNFLTDEKIINKITTSITSTPDDLIIEIGPGSGALTKKLKLMNSHLLAFEIDEETKKFLLPLEDEKTHIIYEDFLETNIQEKISHIPYKKLFIIGNLPYYITTPILQKIIDSNINPTNITVMVQKEVANRFLAKPKNKEYGYMTVLLNFHFKLSKVCDVSKNAFKPIPKVDSTVIKLEPNCSKVDNYQHFISILKEAFQFKRKTIYNNLKSHDKQIITDILSNHGYSINSRAEDLDLETFIDLSNNLS